MAVVEACDRCGEVIRPEPELWDRQGQPIWIYWASYSQRMWLCSKCQDAPICLNDLRTLGQRHLQGSMPLGENLPYMPFVGEKETPPVPEDGGELDPAAQ